MAPDPMRTEHASARQLGWTRRRAFSALLIERVWPTLFGLIALAATFLALAWFGIFVMLPGILRIVLLVLFAAAAVFVLWRGRHLRLPRKAEVDARIEVSSRLAHQPLRTQTDRPSGADPFALALWREHQQRMAARLKALSGGSVRTRTEALDPIGLRALLALLFVTAFAFSFSSGGGRLRDAFAPAEAHTISTARVDAWVTPPTYTGRAPIFLTEDATGQKVSRTAVEVPTGSVLSVRVSDGSDATLTFAPANGSPAIEIKPGGKDRPVAGEGKTPDPVPAKPDAAPSSAAAGEYSYKLTASGSASIATTFSKLGHWTFEVTPDTPPKIAFDGEPGEARNGALQLAYRASDDYGVKEGHAEITVLDQAAKGARPLIPAPEMKLSLPRGIKGDVKGRSSLDLTQSPYAGAKVKMILVALDDAGQTGRSEAKTFVLPERSFTNPLARAVIEERRILALDANQAGHVVDMIDAITVRGEDFIKSATTYLALKAVRTRIAHAPDDETLVSAVDFMWQIALGIEDGDLSLAAERLRDAREKLSDALKNGASNEEIDKLMAELRQAMQDYMQAMAEAMKNMPPLSQDQMRAGNMQELRQQDLDRMLDKIENLAKSGSKDAARQLLSELQNMMDNLQAMRPGQQQQGGQQNAMQQQMDKLGDMLRRQQELMDKTFKLGRQQMERQEQGGEAPPQGEPQAGQQGGENREPMTAEQLQKMLDQLKQQQGQLQKDLQALQKEMQGMGMKPGKGFGEADQAMGRAEGALGQGNGGEAVGEQGKAMEALRQGAKDMMQQMQQAMGQQGRGSQGQLGQGYGPGRQPSGRDPLGRPQSTQGPQFGEDVKVPDEIDTQRAREILDAIRNRLGHALSPKLEREYLERLLQTP